MAGMLQSLQAGLLEDQENLERSGSVFREYVDHLEEEAHDSESPLFQKFVNESGNADAIRILTNFTAEEFLQLYREIEQDLKPVWTMGRGRKSKTAPMDAFLMTLTVLKHYDTWAKHATDFQMKTLTFEKMINRVIDIVEPVLFKKMVTKPPMSDQEKNNLQFQNFPYCYAAHDVKFQPSYRPGGRFTEVKRYFSGKHKLYGLKWECSVVPPGLAVHVSKHYPGAVADLNIALDNKDTLMNMLRKTPEEARASDFGEDHDRFKLFWGLLVDKG